MAERRPSRRSGAVGAHRSGSQRGGPGKPVDPAHSRVTDPAAADFDFSNVGVVPSYESHGAALAPAAETEAAQPGQSAVPAVPADAIVEGFGFRIGALALLTAPRKPAEYLADATVFPLPWAPSRVRGMTQLRGQPVTVFDLSAIAPDDLPVRQQHSLLVIGPASEAAIAILVDAPPRPLRLKAFPRNQRPTAPTLTFAGALNEPMYEVEEPAAQAADAASQGQVDAREPLPAEVHSSEPRAADSTVWWHADFDRLVDELVADR